MRDNELIFEEATALTSSRVATDDIYLGPLHANNAKRQMGAKGQASLALLITVTTAFQSTGSSTYVGTLTSDDSTAFGSATTIFTTPSIAKASMTAGAKFKYPLPPGNYEEYLRLSHTVGTADFTAGALTAEIVMDSGDWYAYADNQPTGGY